MWGSIKRAASALAVVALLGAASAACSPGNTTGVAGSGGSGAAASGAQVDNDASPGVTADSITIGFLITDLGKVQEQLGFKQANYGGKEGVTAQINAIVNAVNANGGLGGRKVIADIKSYEGSQDSPEYAESLCNSFTSDDQVFAVIFEGQFQNNVRPCYTARRTLMIDQGLFSKDQAEFEKFAPFLWSPTFPEYGSFLRTQMRELANSGWLQGSQGVAIVGVDSEVTRRQIQNTVLPALTQAGVSKTATYFVDTSNVGSLGAGSTSALNGVASGGLDRIVVIGGSRILPILVGSQEAATTKAKFAISSYDSPLFLQDNPGSVVASTLDGMVGFGFMPAGDIRDDPSLPFPDPAMPNQVLCKQIIDAAGATPPEGVRTNYKSGLQYCDAALFLKAVIDRAPKELTPQSFRDAAWQVSTAYSSSLNFGGTLQPGKYSAATIGRVLVYDQACKNPVKDAVGCFQYRGQNVPFADN